VAGEAGEEWRDLGVLEAIEFGDDVIALLAGFHPIHEILQAVAAQAELVDALGEHASEKQSVVANVFAHLAFPVERWRRPEYGIGFEQHLADVGQRPSGGGAVNLEELFDLAKFG